MWRSFNQILRFNLTIILFLFYSIVLAGDKISFYMTENDTLWGIKKVAVAEFKYIDDVKIDVASLINRKLKNHQFFQLADVFDIESKLKEDNLTIDDINDISKSNMVCEALEVDALITGKITINEVEPDSQGVEEVSKQVWTGEYERDVDGNIVTEIVNDQPQKKKKLVTRTIKQPYKIRNGTVTILFNLIEGTTSSLVFAKTITRKYTSGKIPKGEYQSLLHEEEILQRLTDEVVEEFITKISPKLHVIKRDIESEEGFIDEGKTYAIDGFWDKAIEIWQKVEEQAPNNPKALYNLGLAHEAIGEYTDAEIYYRKALLLNDKKSYKKAIKNLQKAFEKKEKIFNKGKK